uniref:CCHC-type domain-containing protein n=1 Tax=Tanacetum cinerariifolium TaxID=118510 RepID=A0A6L2LNN5_TANCI|nr:hypothetical protein [Tanacetum cinerariifolium]
MQNPKDISDPTTALDMALKLMSKAFQLNNITLTNNNQRSSSKPGNMQIAQLGMNMDQDRQMLIVEDNLGNQFRPNVVQNVRNHVVQNVVQNPSIHIVENINGLSVVSEITNQYGNGNVVPAPAEGNGNGINGNLIRCYNCRGEGHYANNCTVKPRKRDAASLQQQLQIAQEEDAGSKALKSNLSSWLLQMLMKKLNGSPEDTKKGTSVNTQFSKQSILRKPPSSSEAKLYSVTPFPKSTVIPKLGKSNALSKPVTLNSTPSSRESTVVNNERVISLEIFRINPF